jgi:hypothetical protein
LPVRESDATAAVGPRLTERFASLDEVPAAGISLCERTAASRTLWSS